MIQKEFAERATKIWSRDKSIIGLAAAGSWVANEMDEFSDLDLIVVTKEKIAGNKEKIETAKLGFRFDRERNIEMTAHTALNFLRKFILANT